MPSRASQDPVDTNGLQRYGAPRPISAPVLDASLVSLLPAFACVHFPVLAISASMRVTNRHIKTLHASSSLILYSRSCSVDSSSPPKTHMQEPEWKENRITQKYHRSYRQTERCTHTHPSETERGKTDRPAGSNQCTRATQSHHHRPRAVSRLPVTFVNPNHCSLAGGKSCNVRILTLPPHHPAVTWPKTCSPYCFMIAHDASLSKSETGYQGKRQKVVDCRPA